MERTNRRTALFVLVTILGLVAAACGGGDNTKDGADVAKTTDSTTAKLVDVTDGGTLTYASDQGVGGFNNNTSTDNKASLAYIVINVYPQIFRTSPDFKVTPDPNYVESAEQTKDDPQTVVIKLNKKAVWSDGVPISADDLIYNWTAQNGSNEKVDAASTTGTRTSSRSPAPTAARRPRSSSRSPSPTGRRCSPTSCPSTSSRRPRPATSPSSGTKDWRASRPGRVARSRSPRTPRTRA